MNIHSLLSTVTTGLQGSSTAANQTTATANSASAKLTQAGKRIQSDVETTTAQLSTFGLLKSALADGQAAAQALSKLPTAATPSDVTIALGTFFKTLNAATAAANKAAAGSGSTASINSARRVVSDMRSVLTADAATSDAMKKLGLSVQSDGALAQDAKKFATALAANPAAVRMALAAVGKKVDALAGRELASGGTVGAALSNLNQHGTVLSAQQKALQSLMQAMAA